MNGPKTAVSGAHELVLASGNEDIILCQRDALFSPTGEAYCSLLALASRHHGAHLGRHQYCCDIQLRHCCNMLHRVLLLQAYGHVLQLLQCETTLGNPIQARFLLPVLASIYAPGSTRNSLNIGLLRFWRAGRADSAVFARMGSA